MSYQPEEGSWQPPGGPQQPYQGSSSHHYGDPDPTPPQQPGGYPYGPPPGAPYYGPPPEYHPQGVYGPPGGPPPPRRGLPVGAVIGLLVGGFVILALLAVGAVLFANRGGDETAHIENTGEPPQPTVPDDGSVPQPSFDPNADIGGDGIFLVGEDIEPGDYRATVPEESVLCYWERLSATTGEFEDIIANGVAEPGENVTVTIEESDKAFATDGCGAWRRA
ncbi:hypothetical protein [Stackebrandtia albiflava]|nr:hypothetical protein [Stackebrandtia albiflava]